MTCSVVGPRRSSKALLKVKFALKRKGHGHYLVVCCWSDSLQLSEILAKSLHLRSMLNKLMRCTENCNTCCRQVQKDPILLHDNAQLHIPQPGLQKLNKLGYKFCFIHYIHLTDYHFFKHLGNFLQGKCFHNQQEAENAFQECIKSQSMDFYSTGINKLISCWQKFDCNDSDFD